MIKRVCRYLFLATPSHSAFEALSRMLPPGDFQKIAVATADKRTLFSKVAAFIKSSEVEVMRRVATKLEVPLVEKPSVMRLDLLTSYTVADLRKLGAVGVTRGNDLVGIVCVDPASCDLLPQHLRSLPRYLGTWEGIARALDESERACIENRSAGLLSSPKESNDLVEGVLGVLVSEAAVFGVESLALDCCSVNPGYKFTTEQGKTGSGAINRSLREQLISYCRFVVSEDRAVSVAALNGESFVVSVTSTANTDIFKLFWRRPCEADKAAPCILPLQFNQPELARVNSKAETAKGRVLIIDDNDTFARVLKHFLDRIEIEVVHCSDGARAIADIDSISPDLLICDVHMPGVSGAEILKRIRGHRNTKDLPVIMLTSDTASETEVQLLTVGADAFVTKSEDSRILCAHVSRLLSRYHRDRRAA